MELSTNPPYRIGDAPFPEEFLSQLYPKEKWQLRKEFALHFFIVSMNIN